MTKPTDDKRLDEVKTRHAERRVDIIFDGTMLADMNADIAFLLGKIAEYEARDGAAEQHACGKPAASFIPRWGMSWACVLPKGHTGECKRGGECFKHGHYIGDNCPQWPNCTAEAPVAAPPPQVREAEVERPVPNCTGCGSPMTPSFTCNPCIDRIGNDVLDEIKQEEKVQADRERTAREEGFKAGLKAAAEKRCRFCDDGMVIVNGEHVNSSGNGIPCGAQDILALPVTEIASCGEMKPNREEKEGHPFGDAY